MVQDFVQTTEDEETPREWLHRIMETSSREAGDYDINLMGKVSGWDNYKMLCHFFHWYQVFWQLPSSVVYVHASHSAHKP